MEQTNGIKVPELDSLLDKIRERLEDVGLLHRMRSGVGPWAHCPRLREPRCNSLEMFQAGASGTIGSSAPLHSSHLRRIILLRFYDADLPYADESEVLVQNVAAPYSLRDREYTIGLSL